MSERRAVRPVDREHQGRLGDGADGHDPAPTAGVEAARPSSTAARRLDGARRGPTSAPRAPPTRSATAAGAPGAARWSRRTATVWLFTGCVMDAWMRSTHRSTDAVLTATGASVTWSPSSAACCGALHAHAGLLDDARALARRVIAHDAGRRTGARQLGRMRGGDEGLRTSARYRRGGGVRRQGARRPRVARRSGRRAAPPVRPRAGR